MGADEAEARRGVVDAMELSPGAFDSLADEDEGHDPTKLQTALPRDRLARHRLYSSLAAELETVANVLSDEALAMGALVKPVALAGYEIAKPISKRNDAVRSKIAKALDFYGGRALAAAASRRAKCQQGPGAIPRSLGVGADSVGHNSTRNTVQPRVSRPTARRARWP